MPGGVKGSLNSSYTACRACLRRCWKWFHCHHPVSGVVLVLQEEFQVLCLGLSGSGKTTLLRHLTGETPSLEEPTTGFNMKTLPLSTLYPATGLKGKSISLKELGGSTSIRPFWNHYFHDKHAILFVVNAASGESDMQASKAVLEDVLQDPQLTTKPCLIVGTHSDKPGAWNEGQIEALFSSVMSSRRWACRCCCALSEAQVKDALQILVDLIVDK